MQIQIPHSPTSASCVARPRLNFISLSVPPVVNLESSLHSSIFASSFILLVDFDFILFMWSPIPSPSYVYGVYSPVYSATIAVASRRESVNPSSPPFIPLHLTARVFFTFCFRTLRRVLNRFFTPYYPLSTFSDFVHFRYLWTVLFLRIDFLVGGWFIIIVNFFVTALVYSSSKFISSLFSIRFFQSSVVGLIVSSSFGPEVVPVYQRRRRVSSGDQCDFLAEQW